MNTCQKAQKRGSSFLLNDGDVATETTSRTTRSATKSRRNSTDLVASGRAVERRGRDVAEHHTYFDLWASSSSASSPPEGWTAKEIWVRVHGYFNTRVHRPIYYSCGSCLCETPASCSVLPQAYLLRIYARLERKAGQQPHD